MSVTFASKPTYISFERERKMLPSIGDIIAIEWSNETWQSKEWVSMYMGIVVDTSVQGEKQIWQVYYPSNELVNYYGKHPGMGIWQNLMTLHWIWANPSDEWEYNTYCEMNRMNHKNCNKR